MGRGENSTAPPCWFTVHIWNLRVTKKFPNAKIFPDKVCPGSSFAMNFFNVYFFLIAANMTVTGLSETVIALEQLIVILVDTMEADDLRPRLRPLPP